MAAAASAVVVAANFSVNLLEALIGTTSVNRKIAIGLHNNSKDDWEAPRVHFVSGTADAGMPRRAIPADHVLLFAARKTKGACRGTVGVITCYVRNRNVTVALMWSVPYDYNLYSNWWNVKIISGNVPASHSLYNDLYDKDPHPGDSNSYSDTTLSGTWRYEGSMGHSGEPILEVSVSPA